MDEAFVHPLKVIYKYDKTRLEEIDLPEILNLDSILTRIWGIFKEGKMKILRKSNETSRY